MVASWCENRKVIELPLMAGNMNDVTRILSAAQAGDRKVAKELLPLVYDELRKLAAARMALESTGQTLQPTALVHEAYLRLVGPADEARWDSRGHFFAAAAEAMRRILIDNARKKQGPKAGGKRVRQELNLEQPVELDKSDEFLSLNAALDRLAVIEPRAAEVVKLRYFAGLTVVQAAAALGISARTADDDWAYARAWLVTEIRDGE